MAKQKDKMISLVQETYDLIKMIEEKERIKMRWIVDIAVRDYAKKKGLLPDK